MLKTEIPNPLCLAGFQDICEKLSAYHFSGTGRLFSGKFGQFQGGDLDTDILEYPQKKTSFH
jgi:hypothetical protein